MPGKEYADKPYFSVTTAGQRMVRGYPPPNLFDIFQDYITVQEMSMSQGVTYILKAFFDKLTPQQKAELRDQAEKAREEIKKSA